MACCGDKRRQLNMGAGPGHPGSNTPKAPTRPVQTTNSRLSALRYLGQDPLSLRGPRTGRVYHASGASAVMTVHPDDAPALLRTGLFAADDSE